MEIGGSLSGSLIAGQKLEMRMDANPVGKNCLCPLEFELENYSNDEEGKLVWIAIPKVLPQHSSGWQ